MFFQGKKRLRPISGLCDATAYLAKTSVIARNVGHGSWEACGPEDGRRSIMRTFNLKPKLWLTLLTSISHVIPGFSIHGSSNVLFSAVCAADQFDIRMWEHNAQHSRFQLIWYKENLRKTAIHFWIFTISMMRIGFYYHVSASINMIWVCVQGFGLTYCTQMFEKRTQPVVLCEEKHLDILR